MVSAFYVFEPSRMKILLVKLSSLGDVVHTLPVVQDIITALPDAKIDWVVEKSFATLLQPLLLPGGGLRRVIPCELRRWRKAPLASVLRGQWGSFKSELQVDAYDAVIDLQGLSKSALVARLARLARGGKRFAMANQTDGSSFEAPTRWVADVAIPLEPHSHAVQRGRELAAQALGYTFAAAPDFGLNTPPAQIEWAHTAPENIAQVEWHPSRVALVHGTSRADKEWPLDNWIELGTRLNAAGFEVVLPHGSVSEYSDAHAIARPLNQSDEATPGARVLPVQSLDALTRELSGCIGVIGVDSGISHIAVALGLPHVQIYNFDTAWRTGPLAAAPDASGAVPIQRQFSVFAHPFPEVDAVWQTWLACGVEAGINSGSDEDSRADAHMEPHAAALIAAISVAGRPGPDFTDTHPITT
jgi:heptosyltransferase I